MEDFDVVTDQTMPDAQSALRSNLPRTSPRWFTRRTQWRQLGLRDEDLSKPKIAVVNSSSKLSPCFSHLDPIADAVVKSIGEAGGIGFEIRTVAPTDFIMSAGHEGGYVLSSRDLVSFDIESVVEGASLDGMVCLASCDKTTPGQLMAAARTNIPTLVISCGFQSCGLGKDGTAVDMEEVFIKAGHLARGGVTFEEMCDLSNRAITSPGVCTGMGTANSMHLMAEALGMTLPGYAPVAANSEDMWKAVLGSGRAIVDAVLADRRPRDILTPEAIRNAIRAIIAVSGSINSVKHLSAIAKESGLALDVADEFLRASREIKPIAAIRPNGPASIEEFVSEGGTLAVLAGLGTLFDRSTKTVTGASWESLLQPYEDASSRTIISTLDSPKAGHATIQVLKGNLAPHYAISKLSVTEVRKRFFQGPATVFTGANDAIEAINKSALEAGSVLVVRGLGPVGTPGMGMASNVVFALDGAGLTDKVALVTDGQFSGLVNKGIIVGEVSPEGVGATPLGLVQDGDTITIDLESGDLKVSVTRDEMRGRAANRIASVPDDAAPRLDWLHLFASTYDQRYLPSTAALRAPAQAATPGASA
ncbi:dihydroxy-acid dehydratase [Arthrobacter sp. NPDC089319]|uniref:dihydroxy-acid dehydratase domain-containing protein n=1 Tax=Arthrobacter sp. NPDC089319 TaxID=3155915 RepID=UPI00341ED285